MGPNARISYRNILEFSTPGIASIYRDDSAKGKKLLPCSVYGHFVGKESDIVLIKVFIPQTKQIIQVRRRDFQKYNGTELPGVEALLDGIARQVEAELSEQNDKAENSINQEKYNALILDAFVDNHDLLARCFAAKKKKFDPNVPRSFAEACQYPD